MKSEWSDNKYWGEVTLVWLHIETTTKKHEPGYTYLFLIKVPGAFCYHSYMASFMYN